MIWFLWVQGAGLELWLMQPITWAWPKVGPKVSPLIDLAAYMRLLDDALLRAGTSVQPKRVLSPKNNTVSL